MLGNMLVLLQLGWPDEKITASSILKHISEKDNFTYSNLPKYIINVDYLEEFMHLFMHGTVKLELAPPQVHPVARRIGTRGADKAVKDDIKQLLKLQISRCNDDVEQLIIQFLTQEHATLVENIFGT